MTRDILDDCIECKVRVGELCVAAITTIVITKIIDYAGLADQIESAFDWFVIIAAFVWLSYCIAGSVHDAWEERRERRYTTVYRKRREEAS